MNPSSLIKSSSVNGADSTKLYVNERVAISNSGDSLIDTFPNWNITSLYLPVSICTPYNDEFSFTTYL